MFLRRIRRPTMIVRLTNLFLYPAASEKNSTFFHTPPFQSFSETQFFQPLLNNRKLYTSKSALLPQFTLSADGNPRLIKSNAQAALFDYLHFTRGLRFLDADHISKNSPFFLACLISKVEKEPDISRALTKLLRYHPINEFEPFFESLGLSPKEFASFLPRGFIFLSDDQVMLHNFHTLSDYGVPGSRIGRVYKEANEVFRYEIGVLNMKLRAYENSGLSRSTVIKLVTCCPTLLVGEVNSALIQVLEKLKELGFRSDWIGGYLSSKRTYNWNRILSALCFLRKVGYDDAQMGILLRADSELLFQGSGKAVYLVLGALLKLGLSMNDVYGVVSNNPQILSPKFDKNFWKALHFLSEIGMDPENTAKILCSHMKFLDSHSLYGPKTVLRNFDGCKRSLCEALKADPSSFLKLAFKNNSSAEYAEARNPKHFLQKTDFLRRIGYIENSDEMVKALKRFRGRGDQLQERFDCLVGAGLDYSMVLSVVKRAPTVLNQKKDVLEQKIECLKRYLGYPVGCIVSFPSYLCYDMERISARLSMYKWLREKGAVKPMMSLSTLVACSDARFIKYFVGVHPEGPEVWENLKKTLSQS